jgi:hypothetical protein
MQKSRKLFWKLQRSLLMAKLGQYLPEEMKPMTPEQEQLSRAYDTRNLDEFRRLLLLYPNHPNNWVRNPDGTPSAYFGFAASHGWLDLVKLYVEEFGIQINESVDAGYSLSVIDNAARAGSIQVVEWLLQRGARTVFPDPDGDLDAAPLTSAISEGHLDVVKLLLEHGSPVNLVYRGLAPLDWTSKPEMVALLRSFGAKTAKELQAEQPAKPKIDPVVRRAAVKAAFPKTFSEYPPTPETALREDAAIKLFAKLLLPFHKTPTAQGSIAVDAMLHFFSTVPIRQAEDGLMIEWGASSPLIMNGLVDLRDERLDSFSEQYQYLGLSRQVRIRQDDDDFELAVFLYFDRAMGGEPSSNIEIEGQDGLEKAAYKLLQKEYVAKLLKTKPSRVNVFIHGAG